MKRFLALLLALAALFALAACGKDPARGGEETSADMTTAEASAREETSGFEFSIPALPGMTTAQATGLTLPVIATQPPVTAPPATRPASAPPPSSATGASAAATQATATTRPVTTSTTAAATTTTTTTTTTGATTTTTAAMITPATTTKAPVTKGTFSVTLSKVQSAGERVERVYLFKNQYDQDNGLPGSERKYLGVRLTDFLAKEGVAVSALSRGATLVASAADGNKVTLGYDDIVSDNTLLAWMQDGSSIGSEAPRLCPGNTTGVNSLLFLKGVTSITLS